MNINTISEDPKILTQSMIGYQMKQKDSLHFETGSMSLHCASETDNHMILLDYYLRSVNDLNTLKIWRLENLENKVEKLLEIQKDRLTKMTPNKPKSKIWSILIKLSPSLFQAIISSHLLTSSNSCKKVVITQLSPINSYLVTTLWGASGQLGNHSDI